MAQSAIMGLLRKRMKVIFWATAVVFVGLVVFGWGADITGSRSGKGNIDANIAGRVDDYEITYPMYNNAIQNEYERAYNESRAITDSEGEMIRDRTWFTMVNQYLASVQFRAKGIAGLTDKEVFEALRRDPPDAVKQNENFMTDGQFNHALFEEYLSNPQVDWLPIEMFIRGNLPYDKLRQLINSIPVVTNLEAKREFQFRNELIRASYIKIDPFAIDVPVVDTSDAAVQEYYDKHKDDYYTDEAVVVNYASMPIEPSPADTAEIRALAESLYVRIIRGEEFEFIAENLSDDPGSKMRGGELGWFGKGQMVSAFEEAAFAADSGQLLEPVLSDFGYHIIQVLDKTGEGDTAMVRAAHILLSIKPSMDTEDSVKDIATDFVADVEEGEDFFETAEALGIDSVGQSTPLGTDDPIPGIGFMSSIHAMLFKGKVGDIETVPVRVRERPPLEGVTIIQSVRKIEEGIPSLLAIRDRIVTDMLIEAHEKTALELARKAKKLIANGEDIAAVAETIGGTFDTTGVFGRFGWLEGVGDDPIFKGTAFALKTANTVSEPFLGSDGTAYVVHIDEFIPANTALYTSQELQIKNDIITFRKQDIYERWFANIRERADVVDNRFVERYAPEEEEKEEETNG